MGVLFFFPSRHNQNCCRGAIIIISDLPCFKHITVARHGSECFGTLLFTDSDMQNTYNLAVLKHFDQSYASRVVDLYFD